MTKTAYLVFVLYCFVSLIHLSYGYASWCYQCFSSQSGCGENIDVRLQHWHKCETTLVPNNYCVKIIQKVGGQRYITRGCLNTLMRSTEHRMDMPRVRRHGYCVNAVSYQDKIRKEGEQSLAGEYKRYCFCNDWNGCNTATTGVTFQNGYLITLSLLSMIWYAAQ